MRRLSTLADRKAIAGRIAELLPDDAARWGSMNVHQMVCHLNDAYLFVLGQKSASPASSFFQRTVVKWLALKAPMQWPKGVPTRPELDQGKGGGSPPVDFRKDVLSLQESLARFCLGLPSPVPKHPNFGVMTTEDWMRWGYLHADHHLRQFGR